ncbi:MAG: GreA/GreB family elongation factor [Marinibacterium sp.]|nr:GreA/GreB family elongation factor [Marinibacterium sp.]
MSDRASLKQAIRDRMLALEEAELATAQEHYEAFLNDAKLDEREQHDLGEISEAREQADLAVAFEHPVLEHGAKVEAIEHADFALSDAVGPGAVVKFGGRRFVVLVSTARFDCDGKTYMGISQQSPIYKAIKGLGEGDEFTFNGKTLTLEMVF